MMFCTGFVFSYLALAFLLLFVIIPSLNFGHDIVFLSECSFNAVENGFVIRANGVIMVSTRYTHKLRRLARTHALQELLDVKL